MHRATYLSRLPAVTKRCDVAGLRLRGLCRRKAKGAAVPLSVAQFQVMPVALWVKRVLLSDDVMVVVIVVFPFLLVIKFADTQID